MSEQPKEGNQQPKEETRRCDICGQVLSRMWLTNNKEVQWLFKGEHAHLECYIDLQVNTAIKEHLERMCNDNEGRFKQAVEGLSRKVATDVVQEREDRKGFFGRLFN